MIKHNRPWIIADDVNCVNELLHTGKISTGHSLEELEADLNFRFGEGELVICSSGTAALFLALLCAEIPKNSFIAIPTYACRALWDAVKLAQFQPVVVDIGEDFNLCPESLARHKKDKHISATIAVHNFGKKANIKALQDAGGGLIIEDCSHSFGGIFDRGWIGSLSNICAYSFYATKIITGGQGGAVWCKDPESAEKIKKYLNSNFNEGPASQGFNFRMTDIQAVLLKNQLKRIEVIRKRRYDIAMLYYKALPVCYKQSFLSLVEGEMIYRFVIKARTTEQRDFLARFFLDNNVECSTLFTLENLLHVKLGGNRDFFATAERLCSTTLSIPLYPSLSDSEVDLIVELIERMPLGNWEATTN